MMMIIFHMWCLIKPYFVQTKPREIQVYSLNKLQSVYIESHEVNTQFRQVGLHNEYEGTNEHPVRVDILSTVLIQILPSLWELCAYYA